MAGSRTKTKQSRNRTPPFPAYPAWSQARFWSYLRSGLRAAYNKWPPKWDVLKAAKRPYTGNSKQQKWEFKCAVCGKYYKQKDVSVDHVVPAGALNSFDDIAGFCSRLFVGVEGLQVLCTTCHSTKTKEERVDKEQANAQGS